MPKDKEELKEKKSKEEKKIKELEDELAKLKADVDHWKNEYYRAYADTKNLRNIASVCRTLTPPDTTWRRDSQTSQRS